MLIATENATDIAKAQRATFGMFGMRTRLGMFKATVIGLVLRA
jgi:hypothetical protein